jgi:hypothetical protein
MLEAIIPHINSRIETLGLFNTRFGLCDIISKEGKTFPAEYCKGVYKQVSEFDLHKGTVYHRLNGNISKQEEEEESTVSCDPFYITTFPIRTVVCIKKEHIKGIGNDAYLENKIAQNISNVISETNNKSLRIELHADSVSIEVNEISTNRDEIFREEYTGFDSSFMRYEFVYVAIDYNVIVSGNVSCFELYNC